MASGMGDWEGLNDVASDGFRDGTSLDGTSLGSAGVKLGWNFAWRLMGSRTRAPLLCSGSMGESKRTIRQNTKGS